ncbi:MAG: hypothetical protein KTM48_00225 [Wolbachia endosymbiont of Pissodes strobi]|nr:hypothetical protein [Wolbachia endosymbiont of Pissodes strobi]
MVGRFCVSESEKVSKDETDRNGPSTSLGKRERRKVVEMVGTDLAPALEEKEKVVLIGTDLAPIIEES